MDDRALDHGLHYGAAMHGRRDRLLWIGLAACAGGLAPAAPLPVALAAIVVGACVFVHAGRVTFALASIAFVLSILRAQHALAVHDDARRAILAIDPAPVASAPVHRWPVRCEVEGDVRTSPLSLGDSLRFDITVRTSTCEGDRDQSDEGGTRAHPRAQPRFAGVVATLYVPLAIAPPVGRADRVRAIANLSPPYAFANPDTQDPRPSQARRGVLLSGGADDLVVLAHGFGIRSWIDHERDRSRRRIVATFPEGTSSMARALVLGEDDLANDDRLAFRRSGLAHLLAVSGMHLVLVVASIVTGIRFVLLRIHPLARRIDVARIASAIGIPLVWVYAELAGGSGSAIRAAWMMGVVLLARAVARKPDTIRALAFSLVAMIVVDPLVAFDMSFGLSALATGGLIGLARPIEAAMRARLRFAPVFVVRPLATTLAATIACAPILASASSELSIAGLVANVVAVPLGEAAALPLCLVHALLSFWPAAEQGCALAASGALTGVRFLARLFSFGVLRVPPPTAWQLAIVAAAATGAAFGRTRRWLLVGALGLGLAEIAVRRAGAPHGVVRVTYLDVGQGDAALIDLPDGGLLLVDAGGLVGSRDDVGERVVARTLAMRRRSRIDVVVLSHPHPDHYLGLTSALAGIEVGAFWDTGQGEEEGATGAYAELLASLRKRGVPIVRPAALCGARSLSGASIEVLSPCPVPVPDRGANDNSFVVRVRYGRRAFLFVGDAEHEAERDLVAHHANAIAADVLKVGHHGSRTSTTPAFLAAVAPSVAVMSCGVRNRFGHPHPNTLATLAHTTVRSFRTDRDGAVVVTTDGNALDVASSR